MGETGWIVGMFISFTVGFLIGVSWGFARGEFAEGKKGDKRLLDVSRRYSVSMAELRCKLRQKGVDLVALGIDPPITDCTSGTVNNYPITIVTSMAACGEYDPPDPFKDLRTKAPWEKN